MKKTSKNSVIFPLLIACIIGGSIYAAYMYIIAPKLEQQSQLTSANEALASEASELKEQLKIEQENAEATAVSETELYMKVPAQRDIAPFIKQIEQFEGVSQVDVSGISFNNYDTVVSQQFSEQQNAEEQAQTTNTVEQAEKTIDEKTNTETSTAETDEGEVAIPSTSIDYASLPNNIKLVTASMTVSAMEESEFLDFLKQVQKSNRLIRIDSIDYTEDNPEQVETASVEETVTDKTYPVSATVQLTTFYEQGLATSE